MAQLLEYMKMAVDNIRANKGRSILTMLGIIIGISSVIMIMSIGQGAKGEISDQLNAAVGGQIFISGAYGDSDLIYLTPEDLDYILAGDLLNQCIGTSFGLRDFGIPFYGLYGACSTMGESLALGSLLVAGGFAKRAGAMTSSHFCTAERQYRMPVPYGSQRTPTAQWTATASGCAILGREGQGPRITVVTCGKIVDKGVTDANNMGAAMAPAAYDTLRAHFSATGTGPKDYDLVLTGDLGVLGRQIVADFFAADGVDMGENYQDCGMLLYDIQKQDMHAGASGCGCSASVLCGYLLGQMEARHLKKILFAPTGALLSPTSSFQGESVPGICHALTIEM